MTNTPSPLRYPGGKTILYPKIKRIMEKSNLVNCTYVEAFAGGCGLALKLLLNNDVSDIIINDADYAIYCVWENILNNTDDYIKAIKNIDISLKEWGKQKEIYTNKNKYSKLEIGIATLFLNRTNRSGIIKGGPIGGKTQNGDYKLDCRFNKENIIDKIKCISEYKERIKLYNLDVFDFIDKVIVKKHKNSFIYFDPPYIQKGPELYKNYFKEEDHKQLSLKILHNLQKYNWIITYDENSLVKDLYNNCTVETFSLSYSAGNTKLGKEIMIYSKDIAKNLFY
jgi:DNA adenine methylase